MALTLRLPWPRRAGRLRRADAPLSAAGVILMFAAFLALWEAVSRVGLVDPFIISRPSLIFVVFLAQVHAGLFWRDLGVTVREFAIGYGLAVAAGVVIGFLSGWYRRFRFALEPTMWFLYNAPVIAFYPLLIIWLGLGSPTIIALAFLFAFFPIYVNTQTGVVSINKTLIHCARSFGANTAKIFFFIALPAALPDVVSGLRLGVGRALIGVVVGELIGGNAGLGYRMAYASNHINASLYFVTFVATTVVGYTLTDLLRRLEDGLRRYRSV